MWWASEICSFVWWESRPEICIGFISVPALAPPSRRRLLDALRVFYRASTVLGGLDAAHEWLETPLPAMGGQRPLDFCDTFSGRRLVQQAIAKIEHGEFP